MLPSGEKEIGKAKKQLVRNGNGDEKCWFQKEEINGHASSNYCMVEWSY